MKMHLTNGWVLEWGRVEGKGSKKEIVCIWWKDILMIIELIIVLWPMVNVVWTMEGKMVAFWGKMK